MTVNKQEGNVAGSRIQPAIPIAGVFFKFLLFNAIWCYYTTFTPFSCWESYATALAATLVLSVPYILTRRIAASILVMVVLDIWMVANLLYYRSYFSAIPLSSYLLAGNLTDFLPSVAASFRWCDGLFPASTAAVVFLCFGETIGRKSYFRLANTLILHCSYFYVHCWLSIFLSEAVSLQSIGT